jgi:hypothetical protein
MEHRFVMMITPDLRFALSAVELPLVNVKLHSSNADESRQKRDDATMMKSEPKPIPKK